jgi:hypothetical protein
VIRQNRIFLADTKGFNDPWDCRPCFDMSKLDDPSYADKLVQYLFRSARRQSPQYSEEFHKQRAAEIRADPLKLRAALIQASDMGDEISKRYRVFCLTTHVKNILMWSHYSQNHTGVCFEFSCDNSVFSGAFRVQYSQDYPIFDLTDGADDRVLRPLVTKSSAWTYEDEFRLIAQERAHAIPGTQTLFTDSSFLTLPIGAIKSVILGCLCPAEVELAVRALVQQYAPHIAIQRVVRVADRFNFAIAS